ncbi:MAG: dihydrofolate reductase, partial [Paramuribaculum sp.]|nr:dihydrofolate reductase [Paramuribaculum sp.]
MSSRLRNIIVAATLAGTVSAMNISAQNVSNPAGMSSTPAPFDYTVDRFADIEVLRYKVPGFESLPLRQKMLVYYLTEAAIAGRDILWDQNNIYNLPLRRLLEAVYTAETTEHDAEQFPKFETYLKQIWFANGIHHHYSTDKFTPGFSEEWLRRQISRLDDAPITDAAPLDTLMRVVFDPAFMAKRVNQAAGADLIATSANNLYEQGITQPEVEAYFAAVKDTTQAEPPSYGLNTR